MANERHDAAFVVGALLGGLAGGAYSLWVAPQAGAQTRAELAQRWNLVAERLAQGVASIDAGARRVATQIEERSSPVVARLEHRRPAAPTSVSTETVLLLPDPLEPDPIVLDDAAPGPDDVVGLDSATSAARTEENDR